MPGLRLVALVLLFMTLLLLGACGGRPTPIAAPTPMATPAVSATVLITNDITLGPILTDGAGRALYVEAGPTPNACDQSCIRTWPPLLTAQNLVASRGINTDLIGTVDLGNGLVQVTINGRRLHYFSGDLAPGTAAGRGRGGVWFLLGPDGQPVTGVPAATTSSGH